MASLTPNAVASIFRGTQVPKPVLQVFEIRKINSDDNDRFKVRLSDGSYVITGILMASLNHLVYTNQLEENGLLQLDEYVLNPLDGDNRKLCIILNGRVVGGAVFSGKIGNPVPVETLLDETKPGAGAAKPGYAHPAPSYGGMAGVAPAAGAGAGAVATNSMDAHVRPVSVLNPYNNTWTIKVRVSAKNDKRTWRNDRGEGSLFSVDLVDSEGTGIRGTFFREGVDKFYDVIQENQVYYMSNGKVKLANPRFNRHPIEYELTFDGNSRVVPAAEDSSIKAAAYSFKSLSELNSIEAGSVIDLICVVKDVGELTNLTSKAGKELTKRDLTVVDDSGNSVRLTLWGDRAAASGDHDQGKVMAFSALRVGDYGGRSLSTSFSSSVAENPDISEAHHLRAWWDGGGKTQEVTALSNAGGGAIGGGSGASNVAARHTLESIKAENVGASGDGSGEVVTVKGTVMFARSDPAKPPMYPACNAGGDAKCNKKAIETSGEWRCESCGVTFPEPQWRYILSATFSDHSGDRWATLFNDTAMELVNKSADELHALLAPDRPGEFVDDAAKAQWEAVFQATNFRTFIMRMRVKMESVNGEDRQKAVVLGMRKMDYGQESKVLLNAVEQYEKLGA